MTPNRSKHVEHRTDYYRRRNRIGPGEVVGGVVVLLALAGLFVLLLNL